MIKVQTSLGGLTMYRPEVDPYDALQLRLIPHQRVQSRPIRPFVLGDHVRLDVRKGMFPLRLEMFVLRMLFLALDPGMWIPRAGEG